LAQVHAGQVHNSMRSGRRALALAQESKNVWVQVLSAFSLTFGLLDAGAYEEVLVLTQQAVAFARTLPPTIVFARLLTTLGSTYQALQQGEEALAILEEAAAVAEALDLGPFRVPVFSQLCMHYAVAGEWEAAYRYALKAIVIRKSTDAASIPWISSPHYEMDALLRGGDERQAREAVQRLGEGLGPYPRYRLPYLRSLARLSAWEGQREQAIGHLREATQIAADLGLPGERWQIQAALGSMYEAGGAQAQARTAWASAARIVQELAQGIKDETLRTRFLAGPQIHPVLQHAQSEASPVPNVHSEPSRERPHDLESEKDIL